MDAPNNEIAQMKRHPELQVRSPRGTAVGAFILKIASSWALRQAFFRRFPSECFWPAHFGSRFRATCACPSKRAVPRGRGDSRPQQKERFYSRKVKERGERKWQMLGYSTTSCSQSF